MNKKLIALLIGVSLLAIGKAWADSSGGGLIPGGSHETVYYTSVYAASATVITGAGRVVGIHLSTPSAPGQWAIAIDTVVGTNIADYSAFSNTQKMTTPLAFSTITVTGSTDGVSLHGNYWSPPPQCDGVRFTNGLYIFKNTAASGDASTVRVYWKRD